MTEHKGVSHERIYREPDEKIFHDEWAAVAPHTLEHLLYGQNKDYRDLTDELRQRDAMVAATMIQWLGSNVGSAFLDEVQAKIKDRQRVVHKERQKELKGFRL